MLECKNWEKQDHADKIVNFIVLPFFFGMLIAVCPLFGWITAIMLGCQTKSQLFWGGMFFLASVAFVGSALICLLMQTPLLNSAGIIILFLCGGMFDK